MSDLTFGRAVTILRTVRGLRQIGLAKLIGCDNSFVSLIETDDRFPSREIRLAIIETLAPLAQPKGRPRK